MNILDRALTIVVTATLTSAIWIVFGASMMEAADGDAQPVPARAELSATGNEGAAGNAPGAQGAIAGAPNVADGRAALLMPVAGVASGALVDSFLEPRGENGARLHEAIDIMAPEGTAVVAAAPGTIAKLHNSPRGGQSIYVRSSDGLRLYYYAHLASYASNISEGDRVAAGDLLGTVGASGDADPAAPHLHFAVLETTQDAEWWEPANAINPYPLLRQQD